VPFSPQRRAAEGGIGVSRSSELAHDQHIEKSMKKPKK